MRKVQALNELPYLSPAGIHVFAHRGLASADAAENTIAAFKAAIEAGATHIETDVQATRDGVAVLFHDDDLARVAGLKRDISTLTLAELREIKLAGGGIPTLAETLRGLPGARFNLDVKRANAIEPTMNAIREAAAFDRVLVSSFSESRRKKTLALASPEILATGAGMTRILLAYLAARFGTQRMFNRVIGDSHAIQIPYEHRLIKTMHPKFVARVLASGVRLHYWVVNDAQTMQELVALGAHGVVTDRADVAAKVLREK
jgi:glycerophosphoryl diester phosphodiesterase